jgi:hypothetical protein
VPPTNVETLLRALSDQEVEFIIIGGAAAVLHGSAYVTADLDICYSREKENLTRLAAALAPFNPSTNHPSGPSGPVVREFKCFFLARSGMRKRNEMA